MSDNIYQRYGIRTVINASGPMTRLSGAVLAPEVREAMADAAGYCVRIEDAQEAAGKLIAEVTGAEAGYVTAGAAAGLSLSAAACMAGFDVAAMDRLPDTTGMRNEIVLQRLHVTAYSHALRLPGTRLVETGYVGYPGQGRTWPWQIEAGISENTSSIFYSIGNSPGEVDLPTVVEIGRKHNLPVIVDAAAALPPAENLKKYIELGADLVCFSGGKAIAGPQVSGILAGRADLIESVALQHQDMDVVPETWTWRSRYIESGELPGPPHHGLGRPLKVGKEEIIGLMVALERYVNLDHDAERQRWLDDLNTISDMVHGLPGVETSSQTYGTGIPIVVVKLDEHIIEKSIASVINALIEEDPPIAVSQGFMQDSAFGINPSVLQPGEAETVGMRIRQVLGY